MRIVWRIAGLLALIGIGWWGVGYFQTKLSLDDLAMRAKTGLIAVKGGSFSAGNYDVVVALEDGSSAIRAVAAPVNARDATPVTLADFALSARAATAADVGLFVLATGRTPRPDAALTWQEAFAYCDWLGALAGVAMRPPIEDEWEYAARSRGTLAPWGTAGAVWPPSSTNPSPMGFYGLSEGRYDWVAEDAGGTRIAKGGSDRSSAFYETIPSRTVVTPVTGPWPGEPAWMAAAGYPYHTAYATARCSADTCGQGDGTVDFAPPERAGPYIAQGNPLQ